MPPALAASCAIKAQCTRNKDGRRITRWVDEDLLDEMERRVRGDPEKMLEQDCYWCPAGQRLTFRFQTTGEDREIKYYASSACSQCPIKAQCTCSKDGRRISRWVYEEVLEEMEHRVIADPEKVKLRKQLAEHPFGTIKHHWDQGYFLMRKLPNVGSEMSFSVLAYNLKRTINILGIPKMMEALS